MDMKASVIFIADDNRHACTMLNQRLAARGFKVIEASDGLEALRCPWGVRFDAIILTHEVPHSDARTVARLLRGELDAPIIILSHHPREEFRGRVTQLSDVYYLSKPLDAGKLTTLLDSLIRSAPCDTHRFAGRSHSGTCRDPETLTTRQFLSATPKG
jgi:DNA-binding response OmpR family regulator